MMHMLARLSGMLSPGRRGSKRRASGRRRTQELFPTLQVRVLEERRVFHAGAIAAPVAGTTPQQPPPPPPTTVVSLDAAQNLLVQDASGSGQDDQLTIRFDAAAGHYEISDASSVLSSDISGSTGSGSHTIYVPVAAVMGDSVIVATG